MCTAKRLKRATSLDGDESGLKVGFLSAIRPFAVVVERAETATDLHTSSFDCFQVVEMRRQEETGREPI